MPEDNNKIFQPYGSRLWRNPKVEQAKKLLLQAIEEESKNVTGIRPPDPSLKQSYDELLNEFGSCRGGKLRYPYIGSGLGKGALVELLDGSVKYDFITGIGVHFFGHSHLDTIAAGIEGAISDTVMEGHLQQNEDTLDLLKLIRKTSKLPHAFLTTSGAMAVENAIKIAFQKKYPAYRLLAFEHCFAGRTMSLAQITDKAILREGLPPNLHIDYIPFYDHNEPQKSIENAVIALKKCLTRYPSQYAAMVFELVQGEGGFNCGTKEFFVALMQVLKEHHVAVIVDEVQTFGRLPELFAFQYFDLAEYVDICTMGKLSLVCATLFKEEYTPRVGLLSQTFTSSAVAIRAAKTTIETLVNGDFYGPEGKISQFHNYFAKKLEGITSRNPNLIKGPFGIGGMIAFTPYGGEVAWVTKMANMLFDAGLICFTAGSDPMRIRLLPPLGVLTFDDIDKACSIIEETLIKGQ